MKESESGRAEVARPRLTLRRATAGDSEFAFQTKKATLAEYVEMVGRIGPSSMRPDSGGWNEAEQRRLHERRFSSQEFQVIQVSGSDVGILATTREPDCVKVKQLLILPEHQGRGIGTACMLRVTEDAAAAGLPVRLQVLKVNRRAVRFYERLGFSRTGETATHVLMQRGA